MIRWVLCVGWLVGGCGGSVMAGRSAGEPGTAPEESRLASLEADLDSAEDEFSEATAMAGVDCREVCDLSSRICGLADDICEIADAHPEDDHARDRCEDARSRCERAGTEATARCGCRR